MAAVTSRFAGREDELNATVTHYNIKASEGDDDKAAGAPDKWDILFEVDGMLVAFFHIPFSLYLNELAAEQTVALLLL